MKSLANDAEQALIVNHDAMRSSEPCRAAEVGRLIQAGVGDTEIGRAGGVHRETVRRIRKELSAFRLRDGRVRVTSCHAPQYTIGAAVAAERIVSGMTPSAR